MKQRRLLVVLSAPSGGGKTTICDALLQQDPGLVRSISVTTREPRGQEQPGQDYYFVDQRTFTRWAKADRFLETATVHGHEYGTLKSEVKKKQAAGKDVILVIDVQGGLTVKQHFPEAVLIFVRPPSLVTLAKRLQHRGTDNPQTIHERLHHARWEMSWSKQYDYRVVNQRLKEAVAQVHAVIVAERLRVL